MEKKVKCAEQSRWKDSSNKPPSFIGINKSKPCEIKRDNNLSPARTAPPDPKKKDNQGTKQVSLKETIRKILQSEFKLIFFAIFFQDSNSNSNKADALKQVTPI